MKIISVVVAVLFSITTYCFSSAIDDIQNKNTARVGLYNATFNPTTSDPLGLEQLSEKTTKINQSLTKNVDKNRGATKQEKKVMLQAVFSTEIIYGKNRHSYLADISEDNAIYGHYYVLEHSALLARDFLEFGAGSFDVDEPEYKKLYSYCGLDKAQLFDWFSEMLEQHRPGKQLRNQDVVSQAQGAASYSDSSLSLVQNNQANLTYTVLNAKNCANYNDCVDFFDSAAHAIPILFPSGRTVYDSSCSGIFDSLRSGIAVSELFGKLMSFNIQFTAIRKSHFMHISTNKKSISFARIQEGLISIGSASSSGEGNLFKFASQCSELDFDVSAKMLFSDIPILTRNVTLLGTDTQKEFQDKFKRVLGDSVLVLE